MKIPGRALRAVLGEGPRGGLGAVAVAAGDHSSRATAGRRSKGVAPGMRSAGGCRGLKCTWLGKIHGAWDGLLGIA